MALISRLGVVLGLDTAEFNTNLGRAQQSLKSFAVGAGVIGSALGAAGLNALKFADQINDVAKSNEVAVESILELSTALTLNGGEADNVGKLFSSLSNKLDEASTGNKKAEESFAKLGVSITDIKTLSPDELFRKTLASIAAIENPIKRNATAMDVFGKAIKGTDIKGLNEDLIKAKGTFDGTGESFKKAGEAFDIIDRIFITMKAGFGEELAGAFKAWAQGAETFVKMLIEAKKGLLGLFETGSILPKGGAKTTGGKGVLPDLFGTGGSSSLTQSMTVGDFVKYDKNFEFPKPSQRTDPRKNAKELAQDEEERKKRIARLSKLNAENEAKAAEAARQKIIDDKKARDKADSDAIAASNKRKAEAERLSKEIQQQKDSLQDQVLAYDAQTFAAGRVLTEVERINLALEQGKNYEYVSAKEKEQLVNAAQRLDYANAYADAEKRRLDYQNEIYEKSKQVQESVNSTEILTERLNLEKQLAGQSDTQVKKALEYFDLQKKIIAMQKEGIYEENISNFANAEMKRIGAQDENERAQNTFQAGWEKAYNKFAERAQDSAAVGAEAFNSMAQSMTGALDEFARTGKLSFADLTRSIIGNLLKIYLQAQATGLFNSLFGGSADLSPSATSIGIIGGEYANGGDPPVGVPSLVGERGAELFVPKTAGTIIPNHSLANMMGNQPQVVYNGPYIANMSTIDSKSFEQRIYQSSSAVWAANAYAGKSMPTTGGRT